MPDATGVGSGPAKRPAAPRTKATRRPRFIPRLESTDVAATARPVHRALAIVIGLVVSAVYLMLRPGLAGDPLVAIWESTFGSPAGISQLILLATPLIISGCANAVAQRAGYWNLGVEGQLFMGAWAATAVAFSAPSVPGPVLVLLMVAAGILAGMVWIAVPAFLVAKLNVSELFTTLMLNFVAFLWLAYWATGSWADQGFGAGGLTSRPIPDSTVFPEFAIGSLTIGLGFIIALCVALCLWAYLRYSAFGVRMLLAARSAKTATYAGINVRRLTFSVLLLSGAVAGLLGVVVELDETHRYATALSSNTGYLGIVVAVLAGNSLSGSILTGFVVAFVVAAGSALQIIGVAGDVVLLLTGVILICGASADMLARYRIRFGSRGEVDVEMGAGS